MGQEYFINNQTLEDKIRQLLPTQGGAGAGFDLSASTQIIPVIDVTESAEGSNLRIDLQSSLSHGSVSAFNVVNTTTTIINNTGYYRIFGGMSCIDPANADCDIIITDGSTDKTLLSGNIAFKFSNIGSFPILPFDFIVFLPAGHSVKAKSGDTGLAITGNTRQLADISGNLVNPI